MTVSPNGWARNWTDQLRPAIHGGVRACAIFAQGCLERLDYICDQLTDSTPHRYVEQMNFTGAGTRQIEVPIGEQWTLALIAVNIASSTTVVIRSGGFLRYARVFPTSDTDGPNSQLSAGPGAPIEVTVSAAAEVALHINIFEHDEPQHARGAGERLPVGLPSNSVGTEIERHFPGILREHDPA